MGGVLDLKKCAARQEVRLGVTWETLSKRGNGLKGIQLTERLKQLPQHFPAFPNLLDDRTSLVDDADRGLFQ